MSGIPEELKGPKLLQMAKKIGAKWTDLALALGFEDPDIERFTADNIGNQKEQIRKMLNEWVRKNVEKEPVDQLAKAFRIAELNDLALELRPPPSSQPHSTSPPQGSAPAQTSPSEPASSAQPIVINQPSGPINIGHTHDNKFQQGKLTP